jgi:hypothetical protein
LLKTTDYKALHLELALTRIFLGEIVNKNVHDHMEENLLDAVDFFLACVMAEESGPGR